jgi:REP element-mobilizing transposase RayT
MRNAMRILPQRKPNRIMGYDYSQNGAYFVTICTKDRNEILGDVVGANCVRPGSPYSTFEPSDIGKLIICETEKLTDIYTNVKLDRYVVMPNHVHMLLLITDIEECGRTQFAPTVSRVIKQWKGVITKQIGFSPWQKSFHDHIIRSEEEYVRIAEYIQNNTTTWELDCFYPNKQRS